ncbi:hypothetical protein XCR1_1250025 [Xenorhabdus cabanillasii JM26]|uniref:Uncharacterized protein n=1 Tax=Xenorhabdus cabanillasii JM26 TaxID=1427517 RepID=W1IPT5_9GAMM|nr:hypothetical protein XCR1_1250025 [Xenorhabdus cabanillasii JM26]
MPEYPVVRRTNTQIQEFVARRMGGGHRSISQPSRRNGKAWQE